MSPTLRKMRKKYLVHNAGKVAIRAYSVLFLYAASAISAGAVALPFLAPVIPTKYLVAYSAVLFVVVFLALISRFFAQKNLGANLGDD